MIKIDWKNLTHSNFLSDYWQKKPLFLEAAVSGLEELLDGNDLAGLSAEEDVESRIVFQRNNKYDVVQGPFTEENYLHYGSSHWTLLVQAVNQYLPELSALLQQFKFIPNWLMDDIMVSYATPQGGVGAHFDLYDVFLIQASGTRDWHIGQYCDGSTALVQDCQVKLLEDFQQQETFHCKPRDMLYLPPGLSHHGVATSEHCITYSIGARAPSWKYLIERLSDQLIESIAENDLYQSIGLTEQPTGKFTPEVLLKTIESRIADYLHNEKTKQELSFAMSEAKYHGYTPEPLEGLTQAALSQALIAEEQKVFRDEGSRFLYCENPFEFYINGELIPDANNTTALVKYICDNYVYETSKINELAQSEASQSLLLHLFQQGFLRCD